MTFSIKLIRKMILVAMVLIVFSNIAQWVGDSMSKVVGAVWGIVAAGLAYFCRTKAVKTHAVITDKKYYLWLMVPVLLTIIPLILRVHSVLTAEAKSWWIRAWETLPVLVNFILPVGILWVAYAALTRHMPRSETIDQPVKHAGEASQMADSHQRLGESEASM
ncbi:MAG: hypothetical protein K9N55_15615 [Phycisphaerae bacterium]|nr:hypothetical protein [Phycisphaerae bacterium]